MLTSLLAGALIGVGVEIMYRTFRPQTGTAARMLTSALFVLLAVAIRAAVR